MSADLAARPAYVAESRAALTDYQEVFGGLAIMVWRVPGLVPLLADGPLWLTVAAPWGAIAATGPSEDGTVAVFHVRHGRRYRVAVPGPAATHAPAPVPPGARVLVSADLPGGSGAHTDTAVRAAIQLCLTPPPPPDHAPLDHRTPDYAPADLATPIHTTPATPAQTIPTPTTPPQGPLNLATPTTPAHGPADHNAPDHATLNHRTPGPAPADLATMGHATLALRTLDQGPLDLATAAHISGHAVLGGGRLPCDLAAAGMRLVLIDTRARGVPRPAPAENSPVATAAAALAAGDFAAIGTLLTAAHEALPCDQVQHAAVVAALRAGALGARAITDGPGRPALALVPADRVPDVRAAVRTELARDGHRRPHILTFTPADGPTAIPSPATL